MKRTINYFNAQQIKSTSNIKGGGAFCEWYLDVCQGNSSAVAFAQSLGVNISGNLNSKAFKEMLKDVYDSNKKHNFFEQY